jgi:LacI family transcriptional regulator
VDGLILCSSRLNDCDLRQVVEHFPAVALVSRTLEGAGVSEVHIDDDYGGRQAAEHLVQRGHSRIAFLAGPSISQSGRCRLGAYQQVMQSHRLDNRSELVRSGAPTVEGGYRLALGMLAEYGAPLQARLASERPTAIICHNDLMAVGVLQACAEIGLHVPDHLAVIGYDDIQLAGLVTPALTTVHVERNEMGAQAMRVLLEQVTGENGVPYKVVLKPELIVRASAP